MARDEEYREGRDREAKDQTRDIVLTWDTFTWILDEGSGKIDTHVGPTTVTPTKQEEPVILNKKGDFEKVEKDKAVQKIIQACTGDYTILENPALDGKPPQPKKNAPVDLVIGKKINIAGPSSFALWPGQKANVVQGHRLRKDQYLVIRKYDKVETGEEKVEVVEGETTVKKDKNKISLEKLLDKISLKDQPIGFELVVTGAEISFYMPPSGIEVVQGENGTYVCDAVVPGEMQYCVIIDENGDHHYHRGSNIVFPASPYEKFLENKDGKKVFNAYELTKGQGLHVLVLKPIDNKIWEKLMPIPWPGSEANEISAGTEWIIDGVESRFYPFDHIKVLATIPATIIPEGKGKYIQDLETGKVETIKGSKAFILDPRKKNLAERSFDELTTALYRGVKAYRIYTDDVTRVRNLGPGIAKAVSSALESVWHAEAEEYDSKEAIEIQVPPGVAVMVLGMTEDGLQRKVVEGPDSILLDFAQRLEVLELSTGKPKDADVLLLTCFLQVQNKVSDIIKNIYTKDGVELELKVSIRVVFEGNSEKWFNIKNYIKLLYDHLRSRIIRIARKYSVEEFSANYTDIIRDEILGKKPEQEGDRRPGCPFNENNMKVYDIDILTFTIKNTEVARMIEEAEEEDIRSRFMIKSEERRRDTEKTTQIVQREIDLEQHKTRMMDKDNKGKEAAKQSEIKITAIEQAEAEELRTKEKEKVVGAVEAEMIRSKLEAQLYDESLKVEKNNEFTLSRAKTEAEAARIKHAESETHDKVLAEIEVSKLEAQASAAKEMNSSVVPGLIAAMQTLGDKNLAAALAQNFHVPAIFKGMGIAEIAGTIFSGTPLISEVINQLIKTDGQKTSGKKTG